MKPQSSQQKVQNKGLCPVVSLCLQIKLNQLNFSPFQLIWSFHLKCTFHVSFHMDSCKSRSDAEMCVNLFLESGLMSRWNFVVREANVRTGRRDRFERTATSTAAASPPPTSKSTVFVGLFFAHTQFLQHLHFSGGTMAGVNRVLTRSLGDHAHPHVTALTAGRFGPRTISFLSERGPGR